MQTQSDVTYYSPHPPSAYARPDNDTVGVGHEFAQPGRRPAWNLYWLSDPAVDSFLLDDAEWAESPMINTDLMLACINAIRQELGGVPMRDLLTHGTAAEFAEHLRRHEHTHLKPFLLLKSEWVMTVSERAAAQRGTLIREGNLYSVAFTRKKGLKTNETNEPMTATIMPLALRMKLQ